MNKQNYNSFPLQKIISYSIAKFDDKNTQRELAQGFDRNTEQYAYKHVIPQLDNSSDEQRALQIVGVLAKYGIQHNPDRTFGSWCYLLNNSQIENRLLQIQNLTFSQAIQEIGRIISMTGDSKDVGFNWYQLAKTMFYWGEKGIQKKSQENRRTFLKDYYREERRRAQRREKASSQESEETR